MDEEERREKLDIYYQRVTRQILQYQSASIGLLPMHTANVHNEESHVRDNIYCAMGVWALALAYRHMDDSKGRAYELQQAAVKCMRGILFCYMRQADKVEQFKKNQSAQNSLHVKFNVNTGDTIASDSDWAHLQMDAVSLYLLTLVQMTASGLQIIYTSDEVNFVQNLVYYIERAYRTPDYGMWERGSKENIGHKELNASSIGMAKAALEAINGFNIYGMQGTSSSVIYVDPDAHNRNYTIMNSMLPVASSSKVTDASMLTITGFPAFAVGDDSLRNLTKEMVLESLEGNYGLKRFLRDGYKTVMEDKNRRYYEQRELQIFDGIESEWPIFFIYLALDALFKNEKETAEKYIRKLQDELLITTDTDEFIPHCYYVPKMYLEEERKKPHSKVRLPSHNDGDLFLWGQSLLIILNLLNDGLLDVNEIDPIGRHLSHSAKNRYGHSSYRYSSFKVADSDLVVQVSLIAESRNLQASLATFGIETQTPQQIEPIQIWPPSELVKAYKRLGVNRKLGLTGRPTRPIGSLGTSKIYRIMGKTVVTYPKLLDETDFYMALDMSLLIDEIKTNLALVRNNWNMKGRPTLCLLLREKNLRGKQFQETLELLASFKRGYCGGVKIKLGRLQTMVSTAAIDHLDFLQAESDVNSELDDTDGGLDQARVKEKESVDSNPPTPGSSEGHRLSHTVRMSRSMTVSVEDEDHQVDEADGNSRDLVTKSRESLLAELQDKPSVDRQMMILQELVKREGEDFQTPDGSLKDMVDLLYQKAAYDRKWSAVRRGAGVLKKLVDSLAPGITTILVSGKVVTIGVFGHEEKVIYEPLTPAAIQKILYSFCSPHDVREAVLQQEMVLYLAAFVATMPNVFEGMLKIRIGWIIEAMKQRLASRGLGSLYAKSPSDVKELLKIVLTSKGKLHGQDIAPRTPLQNRQLDGAVHRVPPGFYDKVWSILFKAPEGIKVSNHTLLQLPTISDMTKRERNFQLKVEELLSDISNPEYRQTVVELLVVLATILERNPEVELSQCINLDELVDEALELFASELGSENDQKTRDQFYNTPRDGQGGTTTYLTRAVVNKLLKGNACVSSNCYVS